MVEKLCLKEEAPKGRKRGVSLKQPCETFPAAGGESSLQRREAVIWALLVGAALTFCCSEPVPSAFVCTHPPSYLPGDPKAFLASRLF